MTRSRCPERAESGAAHLFLNYMLDINNGLDKHQLQRLHATHRRHHPAAPGQRANAAAQPDFRRGMPAYFRRGVQECNPDGCKCLVGAGVAPGEEHLGGVADNRVGVRNKAEQPVVTGPAAYPRGRRSSGQAREPHRLFWAALAARHHLACGAGHRARL